MEGVSWTAEEKAFSSAPRPTSGVEKSEEGTQEKKPPVAEVDIDAHPHKQRKMADLDTPTKRPRGNLTLRGLLPMPINHASRKRKADARLKKMMAKNEAETCSDEEKSYIKTLRERGPMAEVERREAQILRDKYEQRRVNSLFFSNTRKSQEETTDYQRYQALINTDLWSPSSEFRKPNGVPAERIASEALASPSITEYPAYRAPMGRSTHDLAKLGLPPKSASEKLAIPEIRTIEDYAQGWDEKITARYSIAFKAGYIRMVEPEPEEEEEEYSPPSSPRHFVSPKSSSTPGRKSSSRTPNSKKQASDVKSPTKRSVTPASSASTTHHARPPKPGRVWHSFHPTRWTEAELSFVGILAQVLGSNWQSLSLYLGRTKSPAIVERTWLRCDGDFSKVEAASFQALKCDACAEKAQLSELVYCDTCYRSYHLHCTYPVLDHIPESDWFCSPNCSMLGTLNCKVCGKATDDDKILVCDRCDRGAHSYCLAVPLHDIPEGEWFCDECTASKNRSNGRSHLSSTHRSKDSLRLESRLKELLLASSSCDHPHSSKQAAQTETQPSLLLQPGRLSTRKALSSLASILVQHSVEIPWRDFVYLSQLCVDCIADADGGLIPPILSEFDVGHALLPSTFKQSIFKHQTDDVPFTSMGETPDAAALNTHFDNLIAATEFYADQAFLKPLIAKNAPAGYVPPLATSSTLASTSTFASGTHQNGKTPTPRKIAPPHSAPITPSSPYVNASSSSNSRSSRRLSEAASKNLTGPTQKMSSKARSVARGVQSPSNFPRKKSGGAGGSGSGSGSSKSGGSPEEWLVEGGYASNDKAYWIFQANPQFYDIRTSLKNLKQMTWIVRQNQSRIRPGDRVFIWESGKDSGIIALGHVVSGPTLMKEAAPMRAYAKDPTKFDRMDLRCQLSIEHVMPEKLLRTRIAADESLANLTILRAPIGTNFKVTKIESNSILALLRNLHPSNRFLTTESDATAQASSATSTGSEPAGLTETVSNSSSSTTASSSSAALPTPEKDGPANSNGMDLDKAQTEDDKASGTEKVKPAEVAASESSVATDAAMTSNKMDEALTTFASIEQDTASESSEGEEDHDDNHKPAGESTGEHMDAGDAAQSPDSEGETDQENRDGETKSNLDSSAMMTDDKSDEEDDEESDESEEEEEEEADTEEEVDEEEEEGEESDAEDHKEKSFSSEITTMNTMDVDTNTQNGSSSAPMTASTTKEIDDCESPGAETSIDSTNTSLAIAAPTLTMAGVTAASMDQVPTPALALVFPMAFVMNSIANFKRLRLSGSGTASSSAMAVGKRSSKSKSSKVPLVDTPHMEPAQSYPSLTPSGFKFKLSVPSDAPPCCPTCAGPVPRLPSVTCAKCNKGYHLHCANKQALKDSTSAPTSSPNWICHSCATQGSHSCPICNATVAPVALEFLSCDCCDEVYHLECAGRAAPSQKPMQTDQNQDLDPSTTTTSMTPTATTPTTTTPPLPWLCKKCDLTRAGLMRAKLCLVLRELRLEVQRLCRASFDIASLRIKKSIDAPEKAGNPLQTMADLSRSVKSSIETISSQATHRWLLWRTTAQIYTSD